MNDKKSKKRETLNFNKFGKNYSDYSKKTHTLSRMTMQAKEIISISVTPEQKRWLQTQPNASLAVQELINSKIKTDVDSTASKLLTDILLKYDLCYLPLYEKLKEYDERAHKKKKSIKESDLDDLKVENGVFVSIETTDYVDTIVCTGGDTNFIVEERQFLKDLRKNYSRKELTNLIWTAIQRYLRKTEIKDGLPLIEFIHENIYNMKHPKEMEPEEILKPQKIRMHLTIKQLADMARVDYAKFYHKFYPRLKRIAEHKGFSHIVAKE